MTTFGRQFLNADKVAEEAGKVAMEKMRNSALMWVGFVAFLFAVFNRLFRGPHRLLSMAGIRLLS
ncbi:hypothetical protein ACOI1H_06105 [Loktanella sp. DJP18]|uniref:hypothetical protein n=1 Tax=Loktanella sp. DJP18 TaxID=3409788 RepID=UPI003BB79E40